MKYYNSPRWSNEFLDCSMPMTFDTYNKCSFNCLYCFSYFQKSHSLGSKVKKIVDYRKDVELCWVNVERIKKMFNLEIETQFSEYIRQRKVMQWGGLSDPFDYYEKAKGITLELLSFFKSINYPLCFSTKSIWWVYDDRYRKLFYNQDNWNVKFSIINLDENKAEIIEELVPSPLERLNAMAEIAKLNKAGVTLRLRPFIIGLSDKNNEYLELIKLAKEKGVTAVSTEFLCLEQRADERLKARYSKISQVLGFDIFEFYRKLSNTNGYLRLNRNIKLPFIQKMYELCQKLNLRFYVSDAHCKEFCYNGSCCGLPESFNYSRGQFTEALMIAKKNGRVYFKDIAKDTAYLKNVKFNKADGLNTRSSKQRVKFKDFTLYDMMRYYWNNPNTDSSPYRYFSGILYPIGLDEENNVIYEYRG